MACAKDTKPLVCQLPKSFPEEKPKLVFTKRNPSPVDNSSWRTPVLQDFTAASVIEALERSRLFQRRIRSWQTGSNCTDCPK